MSITESKYYIHAMKGLIDSTKHRKDIEKNFERSKIEEYEKTCSAQLSYCVELLKIGIEASLENEVVCIPTNDEDAGVVSFSQEEIKEKLGDEAFYILFPKTEETNEETTEDDDDDKLLEDDKDIIKSDNSWQNFNPFSMFLPFLAQFSQPMPYLTTQQRDNNTLVDNPILAVQEEIETLKTEKNKLKALAKRYKTELEEIKVTKESNIDSKLDDLKNLTDVNNVLNQNIENLQTELNTQTSINLRLKQEIETEKNKNEQLSKDVSNFTEQVKELKTKHKSQNTISKLLETTKEEKQNLEKENRELLSKISSLENDIKNYKAKIEELITKLDSHTDTTTKETISEPETLETPEYDKTLNVRTLNDFEKIKNSKEPGTACIVVIPKYFEFLEQYGEDAALETLKGTAEALTQKFEKDNVFISGTNEFVVVSPIPNAETKKILDDIAEKISEELQFDIMYGATTIRKSVLNTYRYLTHIKEKNKLSSKPKTKAENFNLNDIIGENDATTLDLAKEILATINDLDD